VEQLELQERVMVPPDETIIDALAKMDKEALQILLVTDSEGRLLGTVTDGDVRRALLQNVKLGDPIERIMNKSPKVIPFPSPLEDARCLMVEHGVRHVPLVDDHWKVVDLVFWQDLFAKEVEMRPEKIVIMAGGLGTRLDPFTKILPKPMIPVRDKPIVEVIMDRFFQQGFENFVLCLGHKAEIVRLYFNGEKRPYSISFIQEEVPLGTAGALSLLQGIGDTFVLSNCDIIVEVDYARLLQYHKKNKYSLTVLGALKEFIVPYGVLHTEDNNFYIEEKPNFHFLVNTGVYVLEPSILTLLKRDTSIDMDEVIALAQSSGMKVGVYPHPGRWFDIGQWEEYQQTIRIFENFDRGR